MADRQRDLDRFYGLLELLERASGPRRRLIDCNARLGWPERGVYFFFEDGETREDGVTPRVVRVGTHGLRPSKSTLWGRLSQHRGTPGGSMPGGGNHRGSIFRLHVGTALLATGDWPDDIRATWGRGQTATHDIRMSEHPLERAVSDYIGQMPFLWVRVDDPPGPASDRGVIEAGAIALLSNLDRPPVDPPSEGLVGQVRRQSSDSWLWPVEREPCG